MRLRKVAFGRYQIFTPLAEQKQRYEEVLEEGQVEEAAFASLDDLSDDEYLRREVNLQLYVFCEVRKWMSQPGR